MSGLAKQDIIKQVDLVKDSVDRAQTGLERLAPLGFHFGHDELLAITDRKLGRLTGIEPQKTKRYKTANQVMNTRRDGNLLGDCGILCKVLLQIGSLMGCGVI